MSTTIIPGTKLTSLSALGNITDDDLFYVVDTSSNISHKSTYHILSTCVFRDVNGYFLPISGGTITQTLTVNDVLTLVQGLSSPNIYSESGKVTIPRDRSTILYLCASQTAMSQAADRQYVADQLAAGGTVTPVYLIQNFMPLSGGTFTNRVSTTVVPQFSAEIPNLNYVNSKFFSISGGTFTGGISAPTPAPGAPFTQVATVGYVESRIVRPPGSIVNTGSAFPVNNSLNKHSNNGRGNSLNGATFIVDNDNKIRSSGQYGNTVNGGYGFGGSSGSQLAGFPVIPIQFNVNDGTEYAVSVHCTGQSSIILSNLGRVYSAGDNNAGQLGTAAKGPKTRRNTYTDITSAFSVARPVTAIYMSQGAENGVTNCSVYAIESGGGLWSWGGNTIGQLGLGTAGAANDGTVPIPAWQVPTSPIYNVRFKSIAASNALKFGYVLGIAGDDTVYAAGWNGAGQLGLSGVTTGSGIKTVFDPAKGIPNSTSYFTQSVRWSLCALNLIPQKQQTVPHFDGPMTADAVYTSGSTSYALTGGYVYACGTNKMGALGNGSVEGAYLPTGGVFPGASWPFWQPVKGVGGVGLLSAVDYLTTSGDSTGVGGNVSVCAVTNSYTLFNCTTSTGIGAAWFVSDPTLNALYPTGIPINNQVTETQYNQITAYRVALSAAFTASPIPSKVFVWGSNASGQLGVGDYAVRPLPVQPQNAPTGIVKARMCGDQNNTTLFVLDSAGDIYVTGYVNGGLDGRGEGDVTKQNTLQKVIRPQGVKWINFEVFQYGANSSQKTVFAQSLSSDLYVWGYNQFCQAGIINTPIARQYIDVPIKIGLQ